MSVELSMIVKNAERTLARCLDSVRPFVDEILVADTGSSDSTVEIALEYNARLVEVPWNHDFSEARNAALRVGRCDWIIFLDADEVLDRELASSIPSLTSRTEVMGYEATIWNYVRTLNTRMLRAAAQPNPRRLEAASTYPGYVEHKNVRLFRRHPEIVFEGRVHEGVADRMRRLGLKVEQSEVLIHHLGMAESQAHDRDRKTAYYQELGKRKLAESPNDVRTCVELGLGELENLRNPAAALPYFERAIALKPSSNVLWTYAGICLARLGKVQESFEVFAMARHLGASDPVFFEALGDARYSSEDFRDSAHCYSLAKIAGSHSSALEAKLGVCEVRLGQADSGLQRIQRAIEREPDFGELHDLLMLAALFAGQDNLAKEAAGRRIGLGELSPDSYLVISGMWRHLHEPQRAAEVLRSGCGQFPGNELLRSALYEYEST